MVHDRRIKHKRVKSSLSVTSGTQAMMDKVPRIKDIMTKRPLILKPEMIVRDAAKRLLKKGVFAAPVVGTDKKFLGMFSQQGCMVGLMDAVYREVPLPLHVADYLESKDRYEPVTEDEPIMTAVARFANSPELLLCLPVVRSDQIVGVVARHDIIRAFFKLTAKVPDAQEAILYISGLEKRRREIEKLR
jgi:predicted transcriptional regulator